MNSRTAIALIAGLCLAAAGPARAESLDDVLARMDTAAKQFQSYSASVKRVDYTKVLDSTDDSSGTMRLKRGKTGIVGIMDTMAGPDRTVIHFNGPTVEVYLPKAATIPVFNAKKFASTMDEMLLLGFAITREQLKQDYDLALAGPETVDGAATAHITLTPKSPDALKYVRKIDLWIDSKGNSIRQKGTEPSGNYRLASFSNLQVNPPLPDSAFELTPPPGTKRVKEN
jgi:outer membrane lipoprotein-sorting protein